ncbi:Fe-S cluster assembly ATPase SufC [Candidatus Woesearchaeota archaeon CG10_big_fil_rev_8_21_14_0_10_45_16]|nr:MAG: Fe-S cluster assembly ATPase SufC [Candidatus Woesearchaeota archaeon CG10_big_fil_rev_8_21_14_0_10_45_16]
MALEIDDLHVTVEGKEVVKGVSLTFESGKIHVVMGPNGAGKSSLLKAVMGHPKYKVTTGRIIVDGKDITQAKPEERAKAGVFLSFQNPVEVSGVRLGHFLRTAYNAQREEKISVMDFKKILDEKMALLGISPDFSRRYINEGFSGGEKKKAEILQLLVLQPKYAFLDETDSGLDVDAIRTVAENIMTLRGMGIIIVTHYQRFLEYLKPDAVSVLCNGKIITKGGSELSKRIEKEGFTKMESKIESLTKVIDRA